MKIFDEKAIIERIIHLREQHSGIRGKSKFARSLGISASTYNYYENNRIPSLKILLKISEVTGADLNWLLTGKKTPKTDIKEPEIFTFGSNKSLFQKLDNLLKVNPKWEEPISAFFELLCEKKVFEKEIYPEIHPVKSARPSWIPVLGRTAAGIIHFWDKEILPKPKQAVTELDELVKKHIGKTILSSADGKVSIDLQALPLVEGIEKWQANLIQVSGQEQNEIVEFVQCEEVFELFPDSFALHIDGDSMSPRINDGDVVILSPSVPAAQGQIGVVRLSKQIGVTCKLIRSTEQNVHLIPINERYETKVVAKKDLLWALAVLCHISTPTKLQNN